MMMMPHLHTVVVVLVLLGWQSFEIVPQLRNPQTFVAAGANGAAERPVRGRPQTAQPTTTSLRSRRGTDLASLQITTRV
jgi:hypothetical protein